MCFLSLTRQWSWIALCALAECFVETWLKLAGSFRSANLGGYSAQVDTKALELEDVKARVVNMLQGLWWCLCSCQLKRPSGTQNSKIALSTDETAQVLVPIQAKISSVLPFPTSNFFETRMEYWIKSNGVRHFVPISSFPFLLHGFTSKANISCSHLFMFLKLSDCFWTRKPGVRWHCTPKGSQRVYVIDCHCIIVYIYVNLYDYIHAVYNLEFSSFAIVDGTQLKTVWSDQLYTGAACTHSTNINQLLC